MPTRRPRPRKPARPYHHGNLRQALLDEAIATIRKDGVAGITLREIGARVGVSRTALYRHFADKRALLAGVATEGFRTLRHALESAWDGGRQGPASFAAMGRAYVDFAAANPAHYRVMFGGFLARPAPDPELTREATGAFQVLVDAISALQRAALVRTDDTVTVARYVWATVHGVAMLRIDGQLDDPDAADRLTAYAIDQLVIGIARERVA